MLVDDNVPTPHRGGGGEGSHQGYQKDFDSRVQDNRIPSDLGRSFSTPSRRGHSHEVRVRGGTHESEG